jgi:hypothetical protein
MWYQERHNASTQVQKAHCTHSSLPNGIHVIEFHRPTRRSIDEWMLHLTHMHETNTPGDAVRYLIVYRHQGPPPISYAMQRLRQWIAMHPDAAPTRMAFLYENALVAAVLLRATRTLRLPKTQLHCFRMSDRERAARWLLDMNSP